jgi:hypothetical protein
MKKLLSKIKDFFRKLYRKNKYLYTITDAATNKFVDKVYAKSTIQAHNKAMRRLGKDKSIISKNYQGAGIITRCTMDTFIKTELKDSDYHIKPEYSRKGKKLVKGGK